MEIRENGLLVNRKKILKMFDELKKITEPIFFVTNDVWRGIGLEKFLPNYHIVCLDDHPLVDYLLKSDVSVFCLERELGKKNVLSRTTSTILGQPRVTSFIKEKSKGLTPNILFFKPQNKIELLSKKYSFNLLGNPTDLNHLFEDKISFFNICRDLKINVPDGKILKLHEANFNDVRSEIGIPFVLQFGRGWAGNSTFFINSEEILNKLKTQFGNINVKVSQFVKGKTILNNAVIFRGKVIVSKPALQIVPNRNLTASEGGTGGRSWPIQLSRQNNDEILTVTFKVGKFMADKGYKGFFGLDFLLEEKTNEIFLSEDNARLTASSSFYTKLEIEKNIFPLLGYHVLSFMNKDTGLFNEDLIEQPEVEGSEITARNTSPHAVLVKDNLKPGIYNEKLEFKNEAYYLNSNERNDIFVDSVEKGRKVNPEIEVFRINTRQKVCDEKGNLNDKYLELIEKIRQRIDLRNEKT